MVTFLTLVGLLSSAALYLVLSWRIHSRASKLADQFPLTSIAGQAHVLSSNEFSAATVATTISLATVILAFTELAEPMGLWLLWPVITTAAGILAVRLVAPTILRKMSEFGTHRPTLHEFLGRTYGSVTLMRSAAVCTSLGFLGAFAVELTVGSRFLSNLVPEIPSWIAVIFLAGIGVTYTALGGFRAVVVTDRIQMWAIWASIVGLAIAIGWQVTESGGWSAVAMRIQPSLYDFSPREGLTAFLVGIFVINVPTFIADMSIWQRIAASENEQITTKGLWKSIILTAVSWTALALIACSLVVLVSTKSGENSLYLFLVGLGHTDKLVAGLVFLIVVAGLYAANLSTASTQLIATAQTLHTDLLRHGYDRETLAHASTELAVSRKILFGAAVLAVVVVEGLTKAGFSIAVLVFSVYGAQLGMVPAVLAALLADERTLGRLSGWASPAVLTGFAVGWGSAGLGKAVGSDDLVFLAPAVSLVFSSLILGLGWLISFRPRSRMGT